MFDLRGKIACKDPAARVTLMIIDQMTASTCTDASDFTSDENCDNMILSNIIVNVSGIYNSDTRYGNIKLHKTKQVDSETLAEHWNIDLGKAKKTVTRTIQHGV